MERVPITGLRQPITQFQYDAYDEVADDLGTLAAVTSGELGGLPASLDDMEDLFVRKFPSLYCLKYKPIKSRPLTFESRTSALRNRPWQQGIIDDQHPNKVVEKSRQLGMSELSISETIWFLDTHDNTKCMYTFPRAQQMNDFSNTRIAPVFRDSPYLASLLSKEVNNVNTKKVGSSYLMLRSAWGSALGEGADVDMFSADEYDRMKEGVEYAFQEGLKSSKYGLMRRWSTPTLPGFGINGLFQASDQRRYFHTCPHCGHRQFLTAEDNIIQIKPHGVNNATQEIEDGTFIIGCAKCHRELDRWQKGEWVALYPSIKETRGYHISQLDATWISADDIMRRKFRYSSKQLFYNYVLGEPYANEGLIVYEQDVKNSIRIPREVVARQQPYVGIAAGIDWGEPSWMIVLGLRQNGSVDLLSIVWAENDGVQPLKDASTFAAILRTYKPNIIIADAGYGADKNSYMYTQYPAAFYACQWTTTTDSRSRTRFIDQWNEKAREVTVDKTVKTQRTLHTVKNGLIGMFPWCEKLQILAKHLNNTRILDDEHDGVIFQRATRVGPDHTACCLSYALIGIDKLTNYGILLNNGFRAEFI